MAHIYESTNPVEDAAADDEAIAKAVCDIVYDLAEMHPALRHASPVDHYVCRFCEATMRMSADTRVPDLDLTDHPEHCLWRKARQAFLDVCALEGVTP